MKKYFSIFVYILLSNFGAAQNAGNQLFDDSYLHEIRITFDNDFFWENLIADFEMHSTIYDGDGVIPYTSTTVEIDGNTLNSVGIRLKGLSSFLVAKTLKKPFKLDFNEFFPNQTYDGLKKINLHNGAADPSLQREFLSYKMLREMGVAAPRTAFTKLFLNDEYWGTYILVEQIDEVFLKNNFADDDGNLFKNIKNSNLSWLGNDSQAYQDFFDLKTNESQNDWSDFIDLVDIINNTPDSLFEDVIQEILDIPSFLKTLAIDIATNNWDAYVLNGRNFYLYHHPIQQKFHWIPWDYNISWAGRFFHEGNPLPPDNPTCPMTTAFVWTQEADSVNFFDETYPVAESWFWEFGDGTTSSVSNPTHIFPNQIEYEICLTTTRNHNGNICEQRRCETIDLSFNPSECTAIIDSLSPYPADDPWYVQTASIESFCCAAWNTTCDVFYENFESGGANLGLGTNLFLIQNNPTRILVHRLMSIPEFKNQYLQYSCYVQDQLFTEDFIYPIIENNFDLIKTSVATEPYYLFAQSYFAYANGDGSGGGGGALIPPLKTYLKNKTTFLQNQLIFKSLTCPVDTSTATYQSVVINEIMASNNQASGIFDSEGEPEDWIELFNNTSDTIWLEAYFLTNNLEYPKRWQFPKDAMILPNDFLILWADKDLNQNGIHLPFKLPAIGSSLFLIHQNGVLVDSVSYNFQSSNIAFARLPNGTGNFISQSPTFLDNNENTTSSNELENDIQLEIFPNPTSQNFVLKGKDTKQIQTFQLYNQLGKLMLTFSHDEVVNVSHLPTGVYVIRNYRALARSKKTINFHKKLIVISQKN